MNNQYHDNSFTEFVGIQTYYRNCNLTFSSKSKLYKHLRAEYYSKSPYSTSKPLIDTHTNINAFAMKIIQSDSKDRARLDTDFSFRDWNYAYIPLQFIPNTAKDKKEYANSEINITLADK